MNGRFPIAMHIMTLLCTADEVLSSDYMAGSINVNPVLVRKELSNLIKHRLIKSQQGKNGGYLLNRPAADISLAGIYQAVRSGAILGQAKNQPNPACPIGRQINAHLNTLEADIEQTMLNKLGNTTLAAFCKKFE
ncbi:Rrf2 family transcriptional regulator [Mucilaginibacter phyllosphaerae]|uniref:Rrf2 family protein n=1 Tax=Mucilaginibacter phyllosphaerae TaxID=1812349 RepID=A0A4Y8A6T4_9SPHI|nr:Rrf2 family transcriptional regulator [Mucilaginibacter phyllosphaerae]MBB3970962.1 Rrf2 family protein [Mucilaginibacter phyllosphaerae]TEW64106.1 transcriptional regulator [Mucilaginibacter phyllosphaerae]GGH05747.1 Rrf2 family transcriptional regulator [Mucilaginibacter phyllosphaerae]